MAKARERLRQETDIVEMLRFFRLFKKRLTKPKGAVTSLSGCIIDQDCRFSVIELSDSDGAGLVKERKGLANTKIDASLAMSNLKSPSMHEISPD